MHVLLLETGPQLTLVSYQALRQQFATAMIPVVAHFITLHDTSFFTQECRCNVKTISPFQAVATSYKCDRCSERLCIIINNKTFEGERFRHGSDKDTDDLNELFGCFLGFTVDIYEDQSAKEIQDLMKNLKKRRNISQCSCVVVVILSHGCNKEIEGSDNQRVALKDVTKYLNDVNCPPLKGKPKVFIVQACRGSDENDQYFDVDLTSDTTGLVGDSSYTGGVVPNGADMLIAFATVSGHVAYRKPTQGSPFIQKFIEVVRERANDTHLADILLQVNYAVSSEGVQMPSFIVQLRAYLYLWPK